MALDYFLLVFTASIGLYQIVSIHAGLKGLWFFRHPKIQYIFGTLAVLGAYGWFFTTGNRNVQTLIEGTEQLGLFLGGIVAAYVVTAIMSSIIQAKVSSRGNNPRQEKQYELGVETLKTTTVLGGIRSSLRKLRKEE